MFLFVVSITFWETPEVQIGQEGSDYMIMCNVRADPQPIVSWYVNGSIVLDGKSSYVYIPYSCCIYARDRKRLEKARTAIGAFQQNMEIKLKI